MVNNTRINAVDLITIINNAIENQPQDEPRHYIGASSIGHDCMRYIWGGYHGIQGTPFTAKQKRIFEVGHRLEAMILDYMELSGFKVERPEKDTHGIPCRDEILPEFRGNMDGILHLNDHHQAIIEIKTAKASEYKKFVDKGLKSWRYSYYSQCQSYMGMSGIHSVFFAVLNKDTAELHGEWVVFDEIVYSELQAKAITIHGLSEPPPKLNENPCFMTCQMCKYKDLCHKPGNSFASIR